MVVGGGIVGLAIARELHFRHADATIAVVDKEPELGRHASGRNSGVLHSGIYYPEGSLKARVCAQGRVELAAYCEQHGLPLARVGKVILPTSEADAPQLELLRKRAIANGARAELIDADRLRELEPEAVSVTGTALHAPDTAAVDPLSVVRQLERDLRDARVDFLLGTAPTGYAVDRGELQIGGRRVGFGHLINAAGLFADRVAHACGVGRQYTMMPFKGLYLKLDPASGLHFNGLVYPVPDLRVPFLGVHVTRKVDGSVYLGPSALPALGRENYRGLAGIVPGEALALLATSAGQYASNTQGFRALAHQEAASLLRSQFAARARVLVPRLRPEHLVPSDKIGIRAQLFDRARRELVMDFLVEAGERSTHVLNAVSPGFTSAFPFARLVVDRLQGVPA